VILLVVVVHESGHALTAQALGLRWRLYARLPVSVGVKAEPSRLVALGGPAASILAGLSAAMVSWDSFAIVSLFVGLVSLIPIPPQDGWRAIRR